MNLQRTSYLRGVIAALVAAISLSVSGGELRAQQDEYSFDLKEVKKKPWHLGGYLEATGGLVEMNRDGAAYLLRFFDQPEQPERLHPGSVALQLEAGYEAGPARLELRGTGTTYQDELDTAHTAVVEEAFFGLQPTPAAKLELGKRVTRWGTGYAFNPVAFVERPKDPSDPERSREGFIMARGETIHSFQAVLKNVALTLVLLPVDEGLNEDFGPVGEEREWNAAARFYLLLLDTDIALSALAEGTRSARFGLEFSRNLSSGFEVHGEWANISEVEQPVVDASGAVTQRVGPARSWLLGLRHLSAFELTTIAELYHNGAGYSAEELATYYRFANSAYDIFQATDNATPLEKARDFQGAYGRPNAGRNYLYLRFSQKEPFDILYLAPALTAIINLDDQSYALTPETAYTGVTNLELRFRLSWLHGAPLTEYGEKLNDLKAEFRARYFF